MYITLDKLMSVPTRQVSIFAGDEEVMQVDTGRRRGSLAGLGTVVEPGVGA